MKRFNRFGSAVLALSFFALSTIIFSCGGQGTQNSSDEVEVTFEAVPKEAGKVEAKIGKNVNKTGKAKVKKGTEIEFTLTINNPAQYQLEKWEVNGKEVPGTMTAKVKVAGKTDVRAKLKTKQTVKKEAKITKVEIVDKSTPTTVIHTINATDLGGATATNPLAVSLPANATGNLKFVVTTEPNDATVTYDPAALGTDAGHKFTAGATATAVSLKVKKVGTGSATAPEFAEKEYKFRVTLPTPQTKKAKLTALKLVKQATTSEVVMDLTSKLTDAATSAGATIALDYDNASGVALKFDGDAKEPTNATVTYAVENEASIHPDQTITFTKDAKTVTITVSATGYTNATYKFMISVKKGTIPAPTEIKLGSVYTLKEADIQAAATENGFSYVFESTQADAVKVEATVAPKVTATYKFNNADCDGSCTPEVAEKTMHIMLNKTDCDEVKYTLKLCKAKADAQLAKHELKSITIKDKKLTANDMALAVQGKYECELMVSDFASPNKITYVAGTDTPTNVTVKFKMKDSQLDAGTVVADGNTGFGLEKITGVTKEKSPVEIEIEVEGDGGVKTVYKLKINVK